MDQQLLALTADEVVLLCDRCLNGDIGVEPHGLSAFPLLLRLGSAYVDMVGDGVKREGTVDVAVSEAEVWLLRSKVTSGDKTASDAQFGVKLLSKLYRVILAYNCAPLPLEVGGEDDLMTEDRKRALKRYIGG